MKLQRYSLETAGATMRAMVVFRQLMAVLDQKLVEETRKVGLTPQDVLLFAWMEQEPGISGSTLSRVVGRSRQNIQASLERLLRRGLVVKYPSCIRDRTVGWGMSDKGAELWANLALSLHYQDALLDSFGVTHKVLDGFKELITKLKGRAPLMGSPGLFEVPEERETPEWDL